MSSMGEMLPSLDLKSSSGPVCDLPLKGLVFMKRGERVDESFQELYEREAQSVFSTVFLLCRDRALAEDATQEAFARALERWSRLRAQPWVGGWVTSTALNVARRALRRRRLPQPSAEQPPEPEEGIDLWHGVERLPKRQQLAVLLHYRQDLTVAEIAQITGTREGTVRTHLARAREALRRYLKEGELHASG
jgi:RNA polymerase sigma-70 factor (ECF subfamily)